MPGNLAFTWQLIVIQESIYDLTVIHSCNWDMVQLVDRDVATGRCGGKGCGTPQLLILEKIKVTLCHYIVKIR